MNKEERAALLKEVLESPDVPRKVSPRNVLRFVERAQPQTQEMHDFLIAFLSAETHAERNAFQKAWYAKITPSEQKSFAKAYYQCIQNELDSWK